MSGQTRAFPEQPNLRFLKLEAKRRLAAGEFATLHEAQLAVAREHGLPSWTALKETVLRETARNAEPNPVLAQVRWLIARFRDAGEAAWAPPGDDELREHFTERFLAVIPPARVTSTLAGDAAPLREELAVIRETPLGVRAEIGGLQLEAVAEPDPPHRLSGLRLLRLSQPVTDPRVERSPVSAGGQLPAEAAAWAARRSCSPAPSLIWPR